MTTPENLPCAYREALTDWATIAWIVAAGQESRDFFAHRESCHSCTQAWRIAAGYLVQVPNLVDTLLAHRGLDEVLRILPRSDGPGGVDLVPSSAFVTRAASDDEREGLRRLLSTTFREQGLPELAKEWVRPPVQYAVAEAASPLEPRFALPDAGLQLRAAAEGGTLLSGRTQVSTWEFSHLGTSTELRLRVPERPEYGDDERLELRAISTEAAARARFQSRSARLGGVPLQFRAGVAALSLRDLRRAVGAAGATPPLQIDIDGVWHLAKFIEQRLE